MGGARLEMNLLDPLEGLLRPTFGPNGLDVILHSNGQILTSNYGLQLIQLHSLVLSHPMSKFIISSVQKFHKITGDGTKRLLLMLALILKQLKMHATTPIECSNASQQLNILSSLFINELLPVLPHESVREYSISLDKLISVIEQCLNTCLTPHHNYTICKQVKNAILNCITKVISRYTSSYDSIYQTLNFLSNGFESLSMLMTGVHCKTQSISGFIIDREILGNWKHLQHIPVTAILLKCGLVYNRKDYTTTSLIVSNSSDMINISHYWILSLKRCIQSLVKHNVKMILVEGDVCTEAIHILNDFKLCAISMIPKEVMKLIESLTNIEPVYSLDELLLLTDRNLLRHITWNILTTVHHNQYININCLFSGDYLIRPYSFIIESPSIGIGRQIKMAIRNSLKVLSCLFEKNTHIIKYVRSGGCWEIDMIRLIQKYMKRSNIDKRSLEWICLKSIQDGLLLTPSLLVNNNNGCLQHQRRQLNLHQMVYLKTKRVTVDCVTGDLVDVSEKQHVLEPFSSIYVVLTKSPSCERKPKKLLSFSHPVLSCKRLSLEQNQFSSDESDESDE